MSTSNPQPVNIDTTHAISQVKPFSIESATKKLTNKQRIFVNHILENPKDSYVAAAREAYPNQSAKSLYQQAHENLRKPEIVMALSKANDRIEQVLMNTVDEWGEDQNSRRREIAIDTAKYIHDKIHGKAKQSMDINTTSVSVSIDMSGNTDS